MSPSLTERVPADAVLAAILVVGLAGGGAVASMATGPDDPQQNSTASPTPTPEITMSPTPTTPTGSPTASPTPTETETPVVTVPAVPATPTDDQTPTETDTPTETVPPYTDWPGTNSPSAVAPPTTEPPAEPPVAEICHPYPRIGEPNEPIEFSAPPYSLTEEYDRYEWTFETVTAIGPSPPTDTKTGNPVTKTFPTPGTYEVTLTVTDDGVTDTVSTRVSINRPGNSECVG